MAAAGLSGCRLGNNITPVGVPPAVLLRHAPGKIDRHLGMDQAPVLMAISPFFGNVYHGQIQHFQQAVISRKLGFGFCHLAQLAVKSFNGVSGVDQASYLLGILEVGAEIGPVGSPGLGDFRVFLVPALPKGIQSVQGCLLVHGQHKPPLDRP